ncbi:MAG: FAD-dependent oxidoreductase [bacterium]|nr:FAD-dependent oxidoreductase [bacterium]
MLRITNIKLPPDMSEDILPEIIRKKYGIKNIKQLRLAKKSVDARRKNDVHYVYAVDIETDNEKQYIGKNVSLHEEIEYIFSKEIIPEKPVVIAGMGPAGMMCALTLAKNGVKVIVCERGKPVDERMKDVEKFWSCGKLNPSSNVQFGEGGAGTFSDGKLTTGISDFRIRYILKEFYSHGAPEEILYQAKPHIGTDKLCEMAKAIRDDIIANGGEVRFSTKLTDIIIENRRLNGVKLVSGDREYTIETDNLVLAVGHSARDTFEMLKAKGLRMERKPFSIGARIEHSQEMINKSQYGKFYDKFGAADYKLSTHLPNGRSVYTFCMCPGGYVVASASEEGGIVTNGMSCFKRDGSNANSAVLVNITPQDFPGDDVLAGMYFQREIEQKAYAAAGNTYRAPAQRVGDFLGSDNSESKIKPTYRPGVTWTDIDKIFPEFVTESMRSALLVFDRKLCGFADASAILTAPETRSSSPVRIIRDKETMQSDIEGLYPCGEGAGYAGGIISAAVDGVKIAEKICVLK